MKRSEKSRIAFSGIVIPLGSAATAPALALEMRSSSSPATASNFLALQPLEGSRFLFAQLVALQRLLRLAEQQVAVLGLGQGPADDLLYVLK